MKTFYTLIAISTVFAYGNTSIEPKHENKQKADYITEAKAYKMLYENQVNFTESILNTIYYALGGLGGAVVIVLASNWWFNDKKVKDVINEIDTKIKGLSKETVSEITEKVRLEIKENEKDQIINFDKQLEVINENFKQQINSFNENIKLLKELINSKEENLKGKISSEQEARINSLDVIQGSIYRNEYYLWDTRGVHSNALSAQLNELTVKLKNKNINFTFYLQGLLKTLDKVTYMLKSDISHINRISNEMPEAYKDLMEQILKKVDEIPLIGQETK